MREEPGSGYRVSGSGESEQRLERGTEARSLPATPYPLPGFQEFTLRRDGMIYAMDGGLWLHRHVWKGHPMAHLVSTNREALLAYGRAVGLPERRLQFKPLKDPRTGARRDAWHWDLVDEYLPPRG